MSAEVRVQRIQWALHPARDGAHACRSWWCSRPRGPAAPTRCGCRSHAATNAWHRNVSACGVTPVWSPPRGAAPAQTRAEKSARTGGDAFALAHHDGSAGGEGTQLSALRASTYEPNRSEASALHSTCAPPPSGRNRLHHAQPGRAPATLLASCSTDWSLSRRPPEERETSVAPRGAPKESEASTVDPAGPRPPLSGGRSLNRAPGRQPLE